MLALFHHRVDDEDTAVLKTGRDQIRKMILTAKRISGAERKARVKMMIRGPS